MLCMARRAFEGMSCTCACDASSGSPWVHPSTILAPSAKKQAIFSGQLGLGVRLASLTLNQVDDLKSRFLQALLPGRAPAGSSRASQGTPGRRHLLAYWPREALLELKCHQAFAS